MDIKCFLGSVGVFAHDDSVVEGGTGEIKKNIQETNEKKKILVICQYYKPEPFRISDICEEMVRRGHEVQVVTGYPNYPEGILYDGYLRLSRLHWQVALETLNMVVQKRQEKNYSLIMQRKQEQRWLSIVFQI